MNRMQKYQAKIAPLVAMLLETCTEENIPCCVATCVEDEAGNQIAMQMENSGDMVGKMLGEMLEERRANPDD